MRARPSVSSPTVRATVRPEHVAEQLAVHQLQLLLRRPLQRHRRDTIDVLQPALRPGGCFWCGRKRRRSHLLVRDRSTIGQSCCHLAARAHRVGGVCGRRCMSLSTCQSTPRPSGVRKADRSDERPTRSTRPASPPPEPRQHRRPRAHDELHGVLHHRRSASVACTGRSSTLQRPLAGGSVEPARWPPASRAPGCPPAALWPYGCRPTQPTTTIFVTSSQSK